MKKLYFILSAMFAMSTFSAQTITFNGCHNLFDDQNFVFNNTGTYGFGRRFTSQHL